MLRQVSFASAASLANIADITVTTADLVYYIRFACIWNLIFWVWENAPQTVLRFHIDFDIKVWQDPGHSLEDALDIWIETESLTAIFIDDIIMQVFDVNSLLCPLVNEFEKKLMCIEIMLFQNVMSYLWL